MSANTVEIGNDSFKKKGSKRVGRKNGWIKRKTRPLLDGHNVRSVASRRFRIPPLLRFHQKRPWRASVVWRLSICSEGKKIVREKKCHFGPSDKEKNQYNLHNIPLCRQRRAKRYVTFSITVRETRANSPLGNWQRIRPSRIDTIAMPTCCRQTINDDGTTKTSGRGEKKKTEGFDYETAKAVIRITRRSITVNNLIWAKRISVSK